MTPPVIILVGNTGSLHSTEAAYRDAYFSLGCQVLSFQQDELMQRGQTWLYDRAMESGAVMLQYDRTHSPSALTPDWTALWRRLEGEGCVTAGAHLDVYWGIPEREAWIRSGDAQFTVGTLFTADGGSDDKWTAAGVNHRWLAPGCDDRFIPEHAEPIPELAGKVVFVGSAYGYHPCYPGRGQLIDFASKQWPDRFVIYGNGSPNGPVRGEMLARIYASDCVVIGDCCFADQREFYASDRLPESLGRAAVLVMATNDGLEDLWRDGIDYYRWHAGDFDALAARVKLLDEWAPSDRRAFGEAAQRNVLGHDTYRDRARAVLYETGVIA